MILIGVIESLYKYLTVIVFLGTPAIVVLRLRLFFIAANALGVQPSLSVNCLSTRSISFLVACFTSPLLNVNSNASSSSLVECPSIFVRCF